MSSSQSVCVLSKIMVKCTDKKTIISLIAIISMTITVTMTNYNDCNMGVLKSLNVI